MLFKANVIAIALALTASAASLQVAQVNPQCLTTIPPLCCVTSLSISDVNAVASLLPGVGPIIAAFTALGGSMGITCKPIGPSGCPTPTQAFCCLNNNFNGVIAWGCTTPA
ncbi:hypothetical protein JVU11DRAFT_2273 [Chiua virens]|nr:hypothetical protein JVU11DRAFT_2273 [Chiua virens]